MSKATGPRTVQELVGTDDALGRLRKALAQSEDTADLQALLPTAVAQHLTLVRQSDRIEVLAANNAVAQLARFHTATLQEHSGLAVRVRVCPTDAPGRKHQRGAPRLPAEGAASLRDTADSITDPALAASLRQLAAHADDEP